MTLPRKLQQLGGAVPARLEGEELGGVVHQPGRGAPLGEGGMVDDVFEEGDVGLDAADAELAQGAVHAMASEVPGMRRGDHLDEQGIVIGGDDGAGIAHATVQPDAETARGAVGENAAVVGRELVLGILGSEAALDGIAIAGHLVLRGHADFRAVQFVALRDQDLRPDEVEAGNDLGDGVLDLDARVHLDEEPLLAIDVVKEFDSAGVVIANFAGHADRGVAELAHDQRGQAVAGRDLDDLLVTALHRTIALVQVNHVAVAVAENLNFNVLGVRDVFLEEDRGVAKGAAGFGLGLIEQAGEVGGFIHDPHAAAATAEGRFNDKRKTDVARDLERRLTIGDRVLGAQAAWAHGCVGPRRGRRFCRPSYRAIRAAGRQR